MKQILRIIGGKHRGKKLSFPDVKDLRPTPSRVRETLFNWLMQDIRGAKCLDAFAGSGALGFEAYSRGAARVILLEQAPQVFANLQKQASFFKTSNLIVVNIDACHYFQQTHEPFDIIFLDPPFSKNYLSQCLALIEKSNLLDEDGLLYIESDHEKIPNSTIWKKLKAKRTGQVFHALYKKLPHIEQKITALLDKKACSCFNHGWSHHLLNRKDEQ